MVAKVCVHVNTDTKMYSPEGVHYYIYITFEFAKKKMRLLTSCRELARSRL